MVAELLFCTKNAFEISIYIMYKQGSCASAWWIWLLQMSQDVFDVWFLHWCLCFYDLSIKEDLSLVCILGYLHIENARIFDFATVTGSGKVGTVHRVKDTRTGCVIQQTVLRRPAMVLFWFCIDYFFGVSSFRGFCRFFFLPFCRFSVDMLRSVLARLRSLFWQNKIQLWRSAKKYNISLKFSFVSTLQCKLIKKGCHNLISGKTYNCAVLFIILFSWNPLNEKYSLIRILFFTK